MTKLTYRPLISGAVLFLGMLLLYVYAALSFPVIFNLDNAANSAASRYIAEHHKLPVVEAGDEEIYFTALGTTRSLRPPFTYIVSALAAETFQDQVPDRNYRLRLGSPIIGALTVLVVFVGFYLAFSHIGLALAGAVAIGLLPRFVFLASCNNDDIGAIFSVSLLFTSVIGLVKHGDKTWVLVALALSVGLVFQTKYTAWLTLPWIGLLCLYLLRHSWLHLLKSMPLLILVCLVSGGWWLIFNMLNYGVGDPSAMHYASELQGTLSDTPPNQQGYLSSGVGLADLLSNHDQFLVRSYKSFIGYLQWLQLDVGMAAYSLYAAIFVLGLIGIAYRNRSYERQLAHLDYLIVLLLVSQLVFYVHHNLVRDIQPQARYVLPIIMPLVYLFMRAPIALGVSAQNVRAQAPLRAANIYKAHIASPQNYAPGKADTVEVVWRETFTHEGATFISLHFRNFRLGDGDYLVVSDPFGGQEYVLEGRGKMDAGTFWSQHVKGDSIALELYTTRRGGGTGFKIDLYAAGFIDLGDSPLERICGTNDFEHAVCLLDGRIGGADAYDDGRAVARLLTCKGAQGCFLCTGWLASAADHLVTNEHCVTSAQEAIDTEYEFDAEAANCSDSNCQLCHAGFVYSGGTFIKDNAALDYAVIQLSGSPDPSDTYGFLEIDDRDAVVGETIYVPAHPAGRAKEYGFNCSPNGPGTNGGRCVVSSVTEAGCSSSSYNDVGYWLDTEGGSSGAPVIAASSRKVIALHHCHNFCDQGSNQENRGVPIDLVCAEICCILQGTVPCCGNGTCDAGEDCNSCSDDCIGGGGSGCNNDGICNAGDGEDCVSCPNDCNGTQSGRPSNRFCCGDGGGQNPVSCSDSRCTSGNWDCTDVPQASCCGDGTCEGIEDSSNCAVDCGPGCQSNGDCNAGEICCSSSCVIAACDVDADCDDLDACTTDTCQNGGTCSASCSNTPPSCQNGDGCCPAGCTFANDNDCPSCGGNKAPCNGPSDCCSGNCKNGQCKGN